MATLTWMRVDGTLVSSDGQFRIKNTEANNGYELFVNGDYFGFRTRQLDAKRVAQKLADGSYFPR